ncbi:MAG: PIG-L family deacetylase [Bacteroidetes bacterium]|nr:PIG-L family deacetylase [Bacteroidota bacterium]
MVRKILSSLFFISWTLCAFAQTPKTYSSSQIFEHIKKLQVLGSVLYVAAHPDDENTGLLTYLSNEKLYRTGYLSMTRGDGGQNLIGDDQGIELGLIRTQELLSARRIDGAEQFFTSAYDFGFSKGPNETFKIWDKNKILSDVVWVIRKFQPDIIITRFPTTGEGGHGHHTASAILAVEAFDAAADPKMFPEQFKYGVKPWQAKRLLWNTFNFGSVNTERPDQFQVDDGGYNPLLGKSYGEMAAESRSQHKSQGFGVPASRGRKIEFFKTLKGSAPKEDLMDGVVTDWSRTPLVQVGLLLREIISTYSFEHPEKSLQPLLKIYDVLKSAPISYWQQQKLKEVKQVIRECSGLFAEATSANMFGVPGDSLKINFVADNRMGVEISLDSLIVFQSAIAINKSLPENENVNVPLKILVPATQKISQPYWLEKPMNLGSYQINDQAMIGKAQNDPLAARLTMRINTTRINFDISIQYKSNDPVKGEEYEPLFIIPKIEIYNTPQLALSINNKPVQMGSSLKINAQEVTPYTKDVIHNNHVVQIDEPGDTSFTVKNSDQPQQILWSVKSNDITYNRYKKLIQYPHIPDIIYFPEANSKLVPVDLKIGGKRIGYIAGAGDKVPDALSQMGYSVTMLNQNDISADKLKNFDAIVTGVRAYNIFEWLNEAYPVLMNYVKEGGVLLVQYNTNNNIGPVKARIGPFPFTISRNRVTDEAAPVSFIDPKNRLLNFPNKISEKDFEGWIQERSTYHAVDFSPNYHALFNMHDAGEADQPGSLIYSDYGKGRFIYSGLVFFRQLPAGVAGAYRLFANLLAK